MEETQEKDVISVLNTSIEKQKNKIVDLEKQLNDLKKKIRTEKKVLCDQKKALKLWAGEK